MTHSLKAFRELRDTIVNGNPNVALISLFKWDSEAHTAQFWIEDCKLDKMVKDDWFVIPVRVDNYSSLGLNLND